MLFVSRCVVSRRSSIAASDRQAARALMGGLSTIGAKAVVGVDVAFSRGCLSCERFVRRCLWRGVDANRREEFPLASIGDVYARGRLFDGFWADPLGCVSGGAAPRGGLALRRFATCVAPTEKPKPPSPDHALPTEEPNMTAWKHICPLDDIPRLGSRVVQRTSGGDIAVFRPASGSWIWSRGCRTASPACPCPGP